jgi:hypothetical protein
MDASKPSQGYTLLHKSREQKTASDCQESVARQRHDRLYFRSISHVARDFWTRSYPYGIADIRAEDMIDLDECAIYKESADRHIGKAPIGIRVREAGPYSHSVKWTLLMAITCRAGPNDRFVLFEQRPETDVATFYEFLEGVINQIEPGTEGYRRCFTMDNLLAHKHPIVLQLIVQSGH